MEAPFGRAGRLSRPAFPSTFFLPGGILFPESPKARKPESPKARKPESTKAFMDVIVAYLRICVSGWLYEAMAFKNAGRPL